MIMNMKKQFGLNIIFIAILFLLSTSTTLASDFNIRPFLIDKTVQASDIIEDTILLTNDSDNRKYVVFATVNEISVDTEGEIKEFITPTMSDRTNTPTSWVEISRGRIEIEPNGKSEVPLTLRINPNAVPGEYHVFLGFIPAPNRPEAELVALAGEADGVILKITVADERKDSLKIDNFTIDRFVISDSDKTVTIKLNNLGDLTTTPTGEIIFYNSRGEELSSVLVNETGQTIEPGKILELTSEIPLANKLGRFKANLFMRYGENQTGVLNDTTYFYMMSLPLLLALFGGILLLATLLTLLLKRVFSHDAGYRDDGDEVTMYVKQGHEPNPKDHDIDLKNNK
jgi:hypothetical protein